MHFRERARQFCNSDVAVLWRHHNRSCPPAASRVSASAPNDDTRGAPNGMESCRRGANDAVEGVPWATSWCVGRHPARRTEELCRAALHVIAYRDVGARPTRPFHDSVTQAKQTGQEQIEWLFHVTLQLRSNDSRREVRHAARHSSHDRLAVRCGHCGGGWCSLAVPHRFCVRPRIEFCTR